MGKALDFLLPWNSQPPAPVSIDADDALWQSLEAAYYFNNASGYVLDSSLTARYSASATNGAIATTPLGLAWSGARGRYASSTSTYEKIGSGTPVSFSAWVTPQASDTSGDCIVYLGNYAAPPAGAGRQFAVYLNIAAAGDIYIPCTASDFRTAGGKISAGVPVHIAIAYVGGTLSTTTLNVWVNGAAQSLTKDGIQTVALNLYSGYPIKIADDALNALEFRGSIHALHVWSRAITDGDVARLRQSAFAGITQRIFIPAAAAGGASPTLSLPTYMPGSLTSTGFRPRVTAT